ncbi:MAG: hypothetical protein ACRBBW_08220 [Cellvibrionaceae bacterium]
MNDNTTKSSPDAHNSRPSDDEISSLYQRSVSDLTTRPESDDAVLLLAQEKARQLKARRQTGSIPFFGSEAFRGWNGLAAFGIAGVCLWLTLQLPPTVFEEPAELGSAWDLTQPLEEVAEAEIVKQTSEASKEELSEAEDHSVVFDREARPEALTVESVLEYDVSENDSSGDDFSGSDFGDSDFNNSDSNNSDFKERSLSESKARVDSDQSALDRQQKAKQEVLENRLRKQQQKSIATSAEMKLEKKRALEADSARAQMPRRNATSASIDESKPVSLEESALHSESALLSTRKLSFDKSVTRLELLIDEEQWKEAQELYLKLLEDYSEFEIPSEVVEKLQPLRETELN